MPNNHTPPLPDQEARERILTALDRNLLVEAAAGTGKTTSMVRRMVALLRTGRCKVGGIAAVTFTRKAAAELRGRFQIELEQTAAKAKDDEKENLQEALANIERCFIGTIHSFCSRLLRERPIEAGVDVSFRELDDEADARLREAAWDDYTRGLILDDADGTTATLASLGLHYEILKDSFLRFVNYPEVDAWPVGEEQTAPRLDLIAREACKYIAHMQELAPDLPEDFGKDTLIPKYLNLPRVLHLHELDNPVELMELLERFTSAKIIHKNWPGGKAQAEAEKERWDTFRNEVAAKTLGWWYEKRYALIIKIFCGARRFYDRLRNEGGVLNYQDLLLKASELLRDKPHIRAYFRRRFTHLLVDEFQDTDPIQAEVMMFLTADNVRETDWRKCRPRPGALFVVGDPKQSIYRFRRADIMTYNEVKEIIGREGGEVVQLSCNFRSSGQVISWVNDTFTQHFPGNATDASPAYVSLQPGREDGSCGGGLSGIYSLVIPGENCRPANKAIAWEADLIARTIRKELDAKSSPPRSPDDFMIITAKRADLSAYARRLQEYNIPHQVTGGTALNEIRELEMLHTCLRAVLEPDHPVALVALLRSEVFGVSDADLYAFKKGGGRFLYNEKLPEDIDPQLLEKFAGIYNKLRQYSLWLAKLPPVAAIEEISADLGLVALAGSREGGDLEAGGFGKAMELLRSVQKEIYSISQLADYLKRIVEKGENFDSISALSEDKPVVRIMNLHKVKGLEAPIVFLANANRSFDHPVEIHIDRSGDKTLGYLAIRYKSPYDFRNSQLAQPPGWDELASTESAFIDAETIRLRYVAATRAGQALIITQKEKWNNTNPWKIFLPSLSPAENLPDPGQQSPLKLQGEGSPPGNVKAAAENISSRLAQAVEPGYKVYAAKRYALAGHDSFESILTGATAESEISTPAEMRPDGLQKGLAGPEWGSVIHALLALAMENPGAELLPFAKMFLEENELSPKAADRAVAAVRQITKADIWERAQRSAVHFTEAPFHILRPADVPGAAQPPTLLTGTIDLVFKEEGGWVIVDYKTDRLECRKIKTRSEQYAPQLFLYAAAWEECSGETVKETGLYFTTVDKYVRLKGNGRGFPPST